MAPNAPPTVFQVDSLLLQLKKQFLFVFFRRFNGHSVKAKPFLDSPLFYVKRKKKKNGFLHEHWNLLLVKVKERKKKKNYGRYFIFLFVSSCYVATIHLEIPFGLVLLLVSIFISFNRKTDSKWSLHQALQCQYVCTTHIKCILRSQFTNIESYRQRRKMKKKF